MLTIERTQPSSRNSGNVKGYRIHSVFQIGKKKKKVRVAKVKGIKGKQKGVRWRKEYRRKNKEFSRYVYKIKFIYLRIRDLIIVCRSAYSCIRRTPFPLRCFIPRCDPDPFFLFFSYKLRFHFLIVFMMCLVMTRFSFYFFQPLHALKNRANMRFPFFVVSSS